MYYNDSSFVQNKFLKKEKIFVFLASFQIFKFAWDKLIYVSI